MTTDTLEDTKLEFHKIDGLVNKDTIEKAYGIGQDNWGDLPNFQGNYINFGYWKDIQLDKPLTLEDRIKSSKNLYLHIINQLDINNHDIVLEVGCGRGNGMTSIIENYDVKSIIGTDIVPAQIERTRATIDQVIQAGCIVDLRIASADATRLDDVSIDKIFSVEVVQHFKSCIPFAREVKRILKPDGKLVFTAHFSTNGDSYNRIRHENMIIPGDELLPINNVVDDFKLLGFNVSFYSIGEYVFEGYEKWIAQIGNGTMRSHCHYKAYQMGLIDYYVVSVTAIAS